LAAEPLISWPEPLIHLLGFVAAFLSVGAVGFRLSALRGLLASPAAEDRDFARAAARRAAWLGLAGAALGAGLLARRLPELAARHHVTVGALVATQPLLAAQIVLLALALAGFILAARRAGRSPRSACWCRRCAPRSSDSSSAR
jgi:hypothetical protein